MLASDLASIAAQKEELVLKEETIKNQLKQEMLLANKEKEQFEFGTVSIARRRTYQYTEAVKKLEDKVKMKMEDEKKQGLAIEKVTEFVSFRKPKSG